MLPAPPTLMRRAVVITSVVVLGTWALGCHGPVRYGTTSLTSVPISTETGGPETRVVTIPSKEPTPLPAPPVELVEPAPSMPTTPSPVATPGGRAPLVTPGLDNTVTGGVANTGAPLNYGYGNNGNVQ